MKGLLSTLLLVIGFSLVNAQDLTINGNVLDSENQMPIPGVNIIIKNTSQGTISDFDGNFSLNNVPSGSTLVLSYVGYITQEIVVTNENNLQVSLLPDIAQLDEIVVIGYGTQRKKEITGAVSIVSSEIIETLKPTRIEQALQGQVAGVNISSNSGSPGSAATISIIFKCQWHFFTT